MRPVTVQVTGVGVSAPIPCDWRISPFNLSLQVKSLGGAISATVQYTMDDVYAAGFNPATAQWFDHATMAGLVAAGNGTIISPVTAVRLNHNAAGTCQLVVVQAGDGIC